MRGVNRFRARVRPYRSIGTDGPPSGEISSHTHGRDRHADIGGQCVRPCDTSDNASHRTRVGDRTCDRGRDPHTGDTGGPLSHVFRIRIASEIDGVGRTPQSGPNHTMICPMASSPVSSSSYSDHHDGNPSGGSIFMSRSDFFDECVDSSKNYPESGIRDPGTVFREP